MQNRLGIFGNQAPPNTCPSGEACPVAEYPSFDLVDGDAETHPWCRTGQRLRSKGRGTTRFCVQIHKDKPWPKPGTRIEPTHSLENIAPTAEAVDFSRLTAAELHQTTNNCLVKYPLDGGPYCYRDR